MENNTNISTPKNKGRSLGLRRSIRKSKEPMTPATIAKTENISPPQETTNRIASPSTPLPASQKLPIGKSASTTNCLRYRLSVGRLKRLDYKKKKLEFISCLQSPQAVSSHGTRTLTNESEEVLPADLLTEVINKEMLLKSNEKHESKVLELKNAINMWKEAFKASLEELSTKMEPKMKLEDLLTRLDVPPDMIDHT